LKKEMIRAKFESFFKNCEFIGTDKEAIYLANEILREDERLDPLDVLHLSSAIAGSCDGFLFMDKKIKESNVAKRIAKEHKLKLIPFDIEKNKDQKNPKISL